jgi:hypothetical protein
VNTLNEQPRVTDNGQELFEKCGTSVKIFFLEYKEKKNGCA